MTNVSDEKKLNDLSASNWVQHTKSWFVCDGKASDISKDIELHPASFPPELVTRFIKFFTKEKDVVLDPFVGTGSTLIAAKKNQRKSIGLEINKEFFQKTKERIASFEDQMSLLNDSGVYMKIYNEDVRNILELDLPKADFCITSPPYSDMLKHPRGNVDSNHQQREKKGFPLSYGEDERNLGNIANYDKYIDELVKIFTNMKPVLKYEAYIIVILQNFRDKDGNMKPLAWEFAQELGEYYKLQQEFIWCQNQKQLGCWGFPTTYVSNVHHHYCLVFQNIG